MPGWANFFWDTPCGHFALCLQVGGSLPAGWGSIELETKGPMTIFWEFSASMKNVEKRTWKSSDKYGAMNLGTKENLMVLPKFGGRTQLISCDCCRMFPCYGVLVDYYWTALTAFIGHVFLISKDMYKRDLWILLAYIVFTLDVHNVDYFSWTYFSYFI